MIICWQTNGQKAAGKFPFRRQYYCSCSNSYWIINSHFIWRETYGNLHKIKSAQNKIQNKNFSLVFIIPSVVCPCSHDNRVPVPAWFDITQLNYFVILQITTSYIKCFILSLDVKLTKIISSFESFSTNSWFLLQFLSAVCCTLIFCAIKSCLHENQKFK